jgi:hypothetical protein
VIHDNAWRAPAVGVDPVGPAPARLLLALWDHAWDWRPGAAPPFVFPGVEALGMKLGIGRTAVYRALAELRDAGWIREDSQDGRAGWTLALMPKCARAVEEETHDEMQLGFAWPTQEEIEMPANNTPKPVDNVCTDHDAEAASIPDVGNPPSARRDSLLSRKHASNHPRSGRGSTSSPPPDEGVRIFRDYERRRVAKLGDRYTLRTTPPMTLWNLWRELGGNAAAWKLVEAYGKRAIDIAAKAVEAGHEKADQWVKLRADGGEWSKARYDAVMAWQGAAAEPHKPTPPPAPDPVVDGERVTLLEREAWESGGADAVRRQRAEALSSERLGELAGDFLARMRGVG